MKWIGVTGCAGSGKSSLLKALSELGAVTLESDALARVVFNKKKVEILEEFKTLDRSEILKIILQDSHKKEVLESLLHPEIREMALEKKEEFKNKECRVVFYEIPLLFQLELSREFDAVVLVKADYETCLNRLMERKISRALAKCLLDKQLSVIRGREQSAHFVFKNEKGLDSLYKQAKQILESLDSPC